MTQFTNIIKAALIGRDLQGSLTPFMHEAEGKAQKLAYKYEAWDVGLDEFRGVKLLDLLNKAQSMNYFGLNITHPFKMEVLEHLDESSDIVNEVGSANTVIFQAGRKIGHNTDYSGFKAAFLYKMGKVPLDRVLLLGAGGAGGSVAFALADLEVKALTIIDKDIKKAKILAQKLKQNRENIEIEYCDQIDEAKISTYSGIVNTTPMGMRNYPGSAIDLKLISNVFWIVDIVYMPLETELIIAAKAQQCIYMNGAFMAAFQAMEAFELITKQQVNELRFLKNFERLMAERS